MFCFTVAGNGFVVRGLRACGYFSRGRAAVVALLAVSLLLVAPAAARPRSRPVGPDLVVRSLRNPPPSVAPGAALTSAFTVANRGTRWARRSTARAYLSRDSRKGKGDRLLGPASPVPPLKRGKLARRSSTFTIPRATATGKWFLIVCSDDVRLVRETNERNNCRSSARSTSLPANTAPPPPPPPPTGGEPPPIAGQGFTLRFDDQFTTLNRAVWDDHIWYEGGPAANAQYVQNGIFHLVSRRSQGYQETTSTTLNKRAFTYGYFECRMRWTAGPGSWPACWLLSQGWANTGNCSTPASEIDLMEGQGTEPNAFYGTVHRDSARACAGHLQNGNNWQPAAFALAGQWHTYATLWTASQVCWYIDDVQTHCAPTYADTANSPMFLLLQMWIGGWTSGTNSSTPDELHTEIDWVSVWQR